MAFETLLVERERDGMLVVVTFNRPKQLNAINAIVVRELDELCDALETDAAARVILFTGAGDRAFVAGADIRDFVGLTPVEALTSDSESSGSSSRIEAPSQHELTPPARTRTPPASVAILQFVGREGDPGIALGGWLGRQLRREGVGRPSS